jgi:hypothetical protein
MATTQLNARRFIERLMTRASSSVTGATASRYGTVDALGHEMDTVKIIAALEGDGFIGVYHSTGNDPSILDVHLATSSDLMHWTWRVTLAENASMPTIERVSDEAAFEDPANALGGLFADVALDQITSIEALPDSDGFRVIVRLFDLDGEEMLFEELTLQTGTNLSGDDCPLVVDDAR